MQKLKQYGFLIFFAAFILLLSLVDVLTPTHESSEMENRPLEQRPKITWNALITDDDSQKYSLKYETYTNDQFVGRDAWITLKSISESALGKIENNGIVYGKDSYMFEKYTKTDDWRIDKNLEFLNGFFASYSEKAPITFAIVPSAYAVYPERLPAQLQNVDQKAYIDSIYGKLPEHVRRFDVFPSLEREKEDYIYYRTDHHWTTLGAYRAYADMMAALGRPVAPLEALEQYKRPVMDFYGTYYSKCKLFSAVPDEINYYDLPTDQIRIDGADKPSLYDASKWETRDKYAAFLWGNNGVTVINSQNNPAHEEGKTSRVLLIKDSFGNSFAPFLTYSYDEVYVVDLRSVAKLSEAIGDAAFDDVIVMYNFMNFSSDTNIARLTY